MYSVYVGNRLLFATGCEANSKHGLINPKLTVEAGKSGTFNATIPKTNERYTDIFLLITMVEIRVGVHDKQKPVWRGRVFDIDIDVIGNMAIRCEGYFGFLNDTVFIQDSTTMSLNKLFAKIMENHNRDMDEDKQVSVGLFSVPDVNVEYNAPYAKTIDLLTSLVDTYGGYLMPHYTDDGNYIDWVKELNTPSGITMEARDIRDLQKHVSAENVITCLRPIGKDNMDVGVVTNDVALALYGKIFGYKEWNDIEDPSELIDLAKAYLEDLMWSDMLIEARSTAVAEYIMEQGKIPIGELIHARFLAQQIDHDFVLTTIEIALDDPRAVQCTLSAKTIWSQLPTGKELSDVVTTTGKVKRASSSTLTTRTAPATTKLEKNDYFSGDVMFSDNTKLTFRNGQLVSGVSQEGEF